MNIPKEFAVTTAKQSQKLDSATTSEFGIDSFTLMEIAGSSAAKKILETIKPDAKGVFLCGKGNNCGDALVVARYLAQHQISSTIVFISGTEKLSPDAEKNYQLLQSVANHQSAVQLNFCQSWEEFDRAEEPGFIVDGMLGTGLNSELRGDYIDAVSWANEMECLLFAMDIPTGLHADKGQIMGKAVESTQTFAFGTRKQGYYLSDGPKCVGNICFCELPFPNHLKQDLSTYLMDEKWLPGLHQKPASHKYEAGVAYVIAGSEGLTGAAMMAAKSAWKMGIGAVILICPRGILPIFENNLPQIIKKPVGSHDDVFFKDSHLQEILHIVHQKQAPVLLGPGLGRKETTAAFAVNFLAKCNHQVVIDADGLWALSRQDNWGKPDEASWILTPHPGELSRLFSKSFNDDIQRLNEVKKQTVEKNITLLSKGYPVIIGTSSAHLYITGYDTRIFSRAGFGDVLAGKIVSLAALGMAPEESCMHAMLNGRQKALDKSTDCTLHVEPLDLL
jgi:NAD(P)H-hydrate epimerase